MIPIYHGRRRQRGYGIGGTFASLFRKALPLLKSTGFAVGKEALRAGADALDAFETGDQPWKTTAINEGKKAAKRLGKPLIASAGKAAKVVYNDIFSEDKGTLPQTKRVRTSELDIFGS